jgi:UDPglucose--hexose-1-phosphate uridylyltransferase
MSESRYDWLHDRWVVFAPQRAARPDEFRDRFQPARRPGFTCPFCAGNERETPPAILSLPPSSPRSKQAWQVRVVPNRYPALESLSPLTSARPWGDEGQQTPANSGLDEKIPSPAADLESPISVSPSPQCTRGIHEVIIETPEHLESLTQLAREDAQLVFRAMRQRLTALRANHRLHYAVVFKNVGAAAGASLSHSHSQLISTDFVPPNIRRVSRRLQHFQQQHQTGYFEQALEQELKHGDRLVAHSEFFVAFVPYASALPYFVTILPKTRQPRFEESSDLELADFSEVVQRILLAMESTFAELAYNFILHTSPFDAGGDQAFHWRMEIVPRLTQVAGFEWGTDCYINPVLPEYAAEVLREAMETGPAQDSPTTLPLLKQRTNSPAVS